MISDSEGDMMVFNRFHFYHILKILLTTVDAEPKRVGYKTMASYSDEGSSFEQVIDIKTER